MAETRKIAAILAADVVGFSRMASANEDRTLAREARRQEPKLTVKWYASVVQTLWFPNLLDGLRKAGLAEE
jgi:hypothetical protein